VDAADADAMVLWMLYGAGAMAVLLKAQQKTHKDTDNSCHGRR
jgi:hypothetical protein